MSPAPAHLSRLLLLVGASNMKLASVICVLLATIVVANASATFTVYNVGGYVMKLTAEWFDGAPGDTNVWQSDGIVLGGSVSKTLPDTAFDIDYWVNIDMPGSPEIFHKHYSSTYEMRRLCTDFKVWGTIFDTAWGYTCKMDSDGVYPE